MESPHSEDDPEVEELLHQLEDESLLELKLDSFRHGSGRFVTQGRGDRTDALSADLETRYENLKARSFTSGTPFTEVANNKERELLQTDKEEPTGLPHAFRSEPQSVGSCGKDTVFNGVKAEPEAVFRSSTEPLSKPKTQQTAPAKKYSRENSPSPSPPGRCSCFCSPSREPKRKQRSGKRWAASKGGGSGGRGQGKDGPSYQVQEEDEEWAGILQEVEGMEGERDKEGEGIHVSLFDVKKNEKELRRVSKNERKLTSEAQNLVDWVESSSARFALSPDFVEKYLSSKHS